MTKREFPTGDQWSISLLSSSHTPRTQWNRRSACGDPQSMLEDASQLHNHLHHRFLPYQYFNLLIFWDQSVHWKCQPHGGGMSDEKPGDHQSQWASSSGDDGCLYQISRWSVMLLLGDFISDQSPGLIVWQTDIAIPRATPPAWQKIQLHVKHQRGPGLSSGVGRHSTPWSVLEQDTPSTPAIAASAISPPYGIYGEREFPKRDEWSNSVLCHCYHHHQDWGVTDYMGLHN